MNYQQLKLHAEQCQLAADEMAVSLLACENLYTVNQVCKFNLFWLYSLSPVVARDETIEFLAKYVDRFKRNITIKEFIRYDTIIYHSKPKDFDEFKEILKP